jgi:hypothetical protein
MYLDRTVSHGGGQLDPVHAPITQKKCARTPVCLRFHYSSVETLRSPFEKSLGPVIIRNEHQPEPFLPIFPGIEPRRNPHKISRKRRRNKLTVRNEKSDE